MIDFAMFFAVFAIGMFCGHYVSPWLDEKIVNFLKWKDPGGDDDWMLR